MFNRTIITIFLYAVSAQTEGARRKFSMRFKIFRLALPVSVAKIIDYRHRSIRTKDRLFV